MDANRIVELKAWLHVISCAMPSMADRCRDTLRHIAELEHRCDRMAAYLNTHDHTLHDAAMAAAREHSQVKEA